MELRKTTIADIDRIMSILDDARAFQRSMGFRQWEDGYPDRRFPSPEVAASPSKNPSNSPITKFSKEP